MKRIGGKVSVTMVLLLTVLWLMLNQTLALGHVLLGFGLALLLGSAAATLRPLQARLKRLDVAAILVLVVIGDIVRSNVAVARIVLGLGRRKANPAFLDIPLELRDPHGLAALAMIVTSTPGTVWAGLSPDGRTLTLHVLDLDDEKAWVQTIKQRYEQRLIRIFE